LQIIGLCLIASVVVCIIALLSLSVFYKVVAFSFFLIMLGVFIAFVIRSNPDAFKIIQTGMKGLTYSNDDIAKFAVAQNEDNLKLKFPNIISVSDAVHDLANIDTHVIAIYLSDNKTLNIPNELEVKMPDDTVKVIATEIIENTGSGKLHFNQEESINTLGGTASGSFCCMVKTSDNEFALVSSGHVHSNGYYNVPNGWLDTAQSKEVLLNETEAIGNWLFVQISSNQDLALIKLKEQIKDPKFLKFEKTGFYDVSNADVKSGQVTLVSNKRGKRDGFILDFNTSWPVPYSDQPRLKTNIILVGSTNDRNTSLPVSSKGDSGGCVYHSQSKKLVGIILGANEKFTWILPIKDTLNYYEMKLI
jgi:hypothetical protein